ncbi:MAG: type II 3-dehydroquinate dehydratase [Oscillospiraceae bacterium]|nr:type II 3-dehydroquinate dehydratase [Oscillospiraceae bacterium]
MKILVINGPNINMLGIREKHIYGSENFDTLIETCRNTGEKLGVDIECYQSNHEGDLVDKIQWAYFNGVDGIVINPGAYTHTSVAILDAVKAVSIPTVEVHISKVEDREDFRQISYIRQACYRTITGQGINGYVMAIESLAKGEYKL